MLADVFGVTLVKADWHDREHYVAPTAAGAKLFGNFSAKYPAVRHRPGHASAARAGAEVLATTTLPWPAPDASKFSSIHSNPPWQPTDRPEIVLNRFGKGRADLLQQPGGKRRRPGRDVRRAGAHAGRRLSLRGRRARRWSR